MQAVAESGAGFSGASAIHMNIFGLHPVVVFGTDEQKRRFLPPLIAGDEKTCFAVTEPDAGLDTTRLKTRAVRRGDHYVLSGPQDLDLDRAGRRKDADPGAHHADRGGRAAVARHDPVLHRSRPQQGRGARDPEDGPQGGRFEPAVHRRARSAGGGPHRRGGQGLSVHPARHEPGAHPDRRRGGRARPRRARARSPAMPASGSSSAGRSARTRRSSTRSPSAGSNSKRPN